MVDVGNSSVSLEFSVNTYVLYIRLSGEFRVQSSG